MSFSQALWQYFPGQMLATSSGPPANDDSFPPAYFYTQPGATGPGFYDNMGPQSWQEGSSVTGDLYNPHQQTFDQPGNAVAPRRMLWEM
eukprot:CAMPEP_0196739268 /NCGR_PEP_ID=MMETSP1091-20130531/20820_1 /TAXON_ID=302021 /ORGANISM="Rhodomonas sp., Strain CCMP768" /LENGTH=88 /DNA_ID=CAMNT_0042083703 /DNA_START=18 /DNA_END=284 /DNA_ORIENTATION=+